VRHPFQSWLRCSFVLYFPEVHLHPSGGCPSDQVTTAVASPYRSPFKSAEGLPSSRIALQPLALLSRVVVPFFHAPHAFISLMHFASLLSHHPLQGFRVRNESQRVWNPSRSARIMCRPTIAPSPAASDSGPSTASSVRNNSSRWDGVTGCSARVRVGTETSNSHEVYESGGWLSRPVRLNKVYCSRRG
jgi:hypothetical protein